MTMQLKQTLTKENFWNAIKAKYPNASKEFAEWIDEYKKTVYWDGLFGEYLEDGGLYPYKYHDIPYAMQLGIFLTYMDRFEDADDTIQELTKERDFITDLEGIVDCFFSIREEEIKNN